MCGCKNSGPLLSSSCNKDPSILGSILELPRYGNTHMGIDVDVDIDSDIAVSIDWRLF